MADEVAIDRLENEMPGVGIVPPDNLARKLIAVRADDPDAVHLGLVGDTYTVLLTGKDTAGRFCLIDMYIPPGGGPPPHRHNFEETFMVLEGEIEATFRGQSQVAHASETLHVPADAPHQFHNKSEQPTRLLCLCSPAGQEEFFEQVAVRVETRTTRPPKLSDAEQKAFAEKVKALAPKYKTELLERA